jgi:uncharacterized protein (TIGR02145 family)
MKRIVLIIGMALLVTTLMAQAPQAFNYQAVLRGSNNWILSNQNVNLRISILKGSITGTVVYKETHSDTTNPYGVVNLAIGTGTVITGVFGDIDWAGSSHFIKVEADTSDGTNYYDMGTTQLLSVPYTLESRHSSFLTLTDSLGNVYNIVVDTFGIIHAIPLVEQTFSVCGDSLLDTRDGKYYQTVQIGTQCWFKENLNMGTRIHSTQAGYQQQDNGTIEKYCYNNDEANCDIYGGLYEWPEAMQYVTTEGAQGICPDGWHIATDGEWTTLSDYLGGSSVAGGKMKSTGTIEAGTGLWYNPNTGATNESGFTGLPGGYRNYDNGSFIYLGNYGYFWSSSQVSTTSAWGRNLYYDIDYVNRGINYEEWGFSVRCLKDTN